MCKGTWVMLWILFNGLGRCYGCGIYVCGCGCACASVRSAERVGHRYGGLYLIEGRQSGTRTHTHNDNEINAQSPKISGSLRVRMHGRRADQLGAIISVPDERCQGKSYDWLADGCGCGSGSRLHCLGWVQWYFYGDVMVGWAAVTSWELGTGCAVGTSMAKFYDRVRT